MPPKPKQKSADDAEDRIPTVLDLELFDYIPRSRAAVKLEKIEARLADLFQLFERDEGTRCDVRDVGTIVRAMGLNPSEATVLQIIEDVEGEESVGTVLLERLRSVLIGILMTNEYKGELMVRDDEDRILQAFEALDRDNKGYIDAEYLKQVMTTMGEKFSAEEVVEMVSAAADPETGHVYYPEFAAFMAQE